jgi:predicted Holliday junction resolvase-like endonuclease
MTLLEIVKTWWSLILAITGFVIWLVRLESRVTQNSRKVEERANQSNKDLEKLELRLAKQREEDRESREKDWEMLQNSLVEIRKDIKELLQRTTHGQ